MEKYKKYYNNGKININTETILIDFYPFTPQDNTMEDVTMTTAIIDHNVVSLEYICSQMNFNTYISHLFFNDSLKEFVLSYLQYRQRPYDSVMTSSSPSSTSVNNSSNVTELLKLDHMVYQFYQLCRKFLNEFKCVNVIQSVSFFQATKLMSIAAIFGDSNMLKIRTIFSTLYIDHQLNYLSDIALLSEEFQKTVKLIHHELVSLSSSSASIDWNKLVDLSLFLQDCCFSMSSYLLASDSCIIAYSLFSDEGMPKNGLRLLVAFSDLLRIELPLIRSILNKVTPQDDKVERILDQIRKRVTQTLYYLFSAAAFKKSMHIPSIFRIFLTSLPPNQIKSDSANISWESILYSLLGHAEVVESKEGDLPDDLSDHGKLILPILLKTYGVDFEIILKGACHDDSERVEYFLSSIKYLTGSDNVEESKQSSSHHEEKEEVKRTAPMSRQQQIANIKNIFPDYGDLFIGSCLDYFDNDIERTLDALLSGNIPASLTRVDKSIKSAWIGKSSVDSEMNFVNKKSEAETSKYSLEMSQEVKDVHKKYIKYQEQNELYDKYVLSEYADDYDDQYEDSGETLQAHFQDLYAIADEKGREAKGAKGRPSAPLKDWEKQRLDVLRFNSLVREQEDNEQFWVNLEVKNRVDEESEEESQDDEANHEKNAKFYSSKAAPSASKQPKPQQPNVSKQASQTKQNLASNKPLEGKNKGENPQNQQKKSKQNDKEANEEKVPADKSNQQQQKQHHNTKKFDKHHQKDRSLKKGGIL